MKNYTITVNGQTYVVQVEEGITAAAQQALDLAQDLPKPLIYIGGSTFVVAEALPLFNKNTEA